MLPIRFLEWFGVRHSQFIILFLGMTIAYSLRVNLSVGIVAMTDNSTDFQTVNWTNAEKGLVLSSFFYGYLITQIPAGMLAAKVGASTPLGIAMIINGLSTLILPYVALRSVYLACAARVVQGLGQGFIYPCMNTFMGKWAIPEERSRVFSFVFGGTQFGTIAMLITGGLLAGSSAGWPSIFYGSGGLAVAWGIICLCFISDSPEKHRTISEEEKRFIESKMISSKKQDEIPETPWFDMLKSIPLWSLLTVHLAQNWGFWTLLTLMPTFISSVLHFDIKKNGFLSALPYFVMWIASFLFAFTADFLVKKKVFSFGTSRKVWNSLGLYGGAVALGLLSILNTDAVGAIALLTVAVGLNGTQFSGFMLNHLDLSPNFAGTLMGITNGLSNITSILAPTIAGLIVTQSDNLSQWQTVFMISAAVFFVGETVFNIFGSGEVQPWNDGPQRRRTSENLSDVEGKMGKT